MKPEIFYEDKHLLVCRKPAKIAVQSRHLGTLDMVSILKNYLFQTCDRKGEPYLAVIHRLDQPVEGLLVFAKTPDAARALNQQLTELSFGKHYLALLQNPLPENEGILEDYLIKDARTNTSRVCDSSVPGAKKAVLHYKMLPSSDGDYLCEIQLKTGRHHQIRVQMAHAGAPLLGDTKYNPLALVPGKWTQISLCAYKLSFTHPFTHKEMTFQITPSFLAKDSAKPHTF